MVFSFFFYLFLRIGNVVTSIISNVSVERCWKDNVLVRIECRSYILSTRGRQYTNKNLVKIVIFFS